MTDVRNAADATVPGGEKQDFEEIQKFRSGFEGEPDQRGGGAAELADTAVSRTELSLGLLNVAIWFVLFAGGVLISSQPFRNEIAEFTSFRSWVAAFVMTLLFWTITNVGILACSAALLGAFGRRTKFVVREMRSGSPERDNSPALPRDIGTYYVSAIMRGFGIYILALAGLLVLATEAFKNPDQGEYLRLAGTMSIVAFYAGYDPSTFAGLLDRVKQFFESR